MKKCPFWSSKGKKENCYAECPMHEEFGVNETCAFLEISNRGSISFKDIMYNSYENDPYYSDYYNKIAIYN